MATEVNQIRGKIRRLETKITDLDMEKDHIIGEIYYMESEKAELKRKLDAILGDKE